MKGKRCILIDDIVDTGETLCRAATLLKKEGAKTVKAVVTHPVLSANSKQILESSSLEKVFVTDSIPHDLLPSKFQVLRIAPLLSEVLSKSALDS